MTLFPAAFTSGVAYVLLALLSAVLVAVVTAAPPGMLEAVAGLALIGTLAASASSALAVAEERTAASVAFLLAASGLSFAGIGAAFWALAAGLLVRWIFKDRKPSL
ncbi:putative benzoate:H+ symporter BenE [Arthrobacter pascens]|nr:putative benzoate:H+ symporter BenE [Arthrobacter pascens]